MLVVTHSRSARLCRCLAFLARFGANLASLSTNASLNLSAIGNSIELKMGGVVLSLDPGTAQVFGSMSSTTKSSNVTPGNACLGISIPLWPKSDGFGFTKIRGHSVDKLSSESSSIFGCKKNKHIEQKDGHEGRIA